MLDKYLIHELQLILGNISFSCHQRTYSYYNSHQVFFNSDHLELESAFPTIRLPKNIISCLKSILDMECPEEYVIIFNASSLCWEPENTCINFKILNNSFVVSRLLMYTCGIDS